jgi:O-antigen ligase
MFLVVSGYADYQTGILSSNFKITTSDVGKITKNDDDIAQVGTGRGELWMGAIECIKDNPILGCGPENISYYNEKLGEPHNEILMFGAEDGIIAMCMYIIGLISIFVTNIKRVRKIDRLKIAAGGVVCAYVVSSVFGVMVFYAAAFYYIFLGNIS